ncbi:tectonin domain-containing protein [Streptomyces bobili]|uniref:tectonin domain-containing protein n=1 Tax=Streptomyces bobili TaxID=67280 RepID=UPI0037B1B6FA
MGAGADGTVWGVNAAGNIYRYAGDQEESADQWVQIPGNLTRIAVGSRTNVWGVNASGGIYKFSGFDFLTPSPWVKIPGSLSDIGAAADGTVWASTQRGRSTVTPATRTTRTTGPRSPAT